MNDGVLRPNQKPFDFWDIYDMPDSNRFEVGIPEFYVIFFEDSTKVASLGWWDGDELLWLLEYYHASGDQLVFYTLDEEMAMDEVSSQDWFHFVSRKTPQCLPWILFNLPELSLS